MRLMDYLPPQAYGGEEHVEDLQGALDAAIAELRAARDELLEQVRVATAGDGWGLDEHEREWGIAPDPDKAAWQRRALWRAKRRGTGTSTLAQVQSVAQSFTAGAVTVREYPQEYRFRIDVEVDHAGPPALDDMLAAVEVIKPAHLALHLRLQLGLRGVLYLGLAQSLTKHIRLLPAWDTAMQVQFPARIALGIHIAKQITLR